MNADERKSSYEDSRDPKKLADNESETASNDDKFPGYPHYPAKEDIMHPTNRMEKIAPDPENLTKSGMYVDYKIVNTEYRDVCVSYFICITTF